MEGVELLRLAVFCGAGLLICLYVVFIFVHLTAIAFGYWLFSFKTSDLKAKPEEYPGVSVLKPIVGTDANLRTNLESYFKLDYPKYELLFSVAEKENPPSLPIILSLMKQYPNVSAQVFQGIAMIGVNPKINNMLRAYQSAKYNFLWISDFNILCRPETLKEMMSRMRDPKVAYVHQLPFTTGGNSFADCLEKVYFGAQHARVYLVAQVLDQNCATGMSAVVRKSALVAEGGLEAFSEYLAEDFFISKALWERGWKLRISHLPALQNSSSRSLSAFQNRMIRWGRLRAVMMPCPGLFEPFTESVVLGVMMSLSVRVVFGWNPLVFFAGHCLLWLAFDIVLYSAIQHEIWRPFGKCLLAWCLREVWTYPLFLAGVWSRDVVWKGSRFRLHSGGKAYKID